MSKILLWPQDHLTEHLSTFYMRIRTNPEYHCEIQMLFLKQTLCTEEITVHSNYCACQQTESCANSFFSIWDWKSWVT